MFKGVGAGPCFNKSMVGIEYGCDGMILGEGPNPAQTAISVLSQHGNREMNGKVKKTLGRMRRVKQSPIVKLKRVDTEIPVLCEVVVS